MHRVTTPVLSDERLKGMTLLPARFSTAFFVHPAKDVDIEPIVWEGEAGPKYEKVNAGEWRVRNTSKNYSSLLAATAA